MGNRARARLTPSHISIYNILELPKEDLLIPIINSISKGHFIKTSLYADIFHQGIESQGAVDIDTKNTLKQAMANIRAEGLDAPRLQEVLKLIATTGDEDLIKQYIPEFLAYFEKPLIKVKYLSEHSDLFKNFTHNLIKKSELENSKNLFRHLTNQEKGNFLYSQLCCNKPNSNKVALMFLEAMDEDINVKDTINKLIAQDFINNPEKVEKILTIFTNISKMNGTQASAKAKNLALSIRDAFFLETNNLHMDSATHIHIAEDYITEGLKSRHYGGILHIMHNFRRTPGARNYHHDNLLKILNHINSLGNYHGSVVTLLEDLIKLEKSWFPRDHQKLLSEILLKLTNQIKYESEVSLKILNLIIDGTKLLPEDYDQELIKASLIKLDFEKRLNIEFSLEGIKQKEKSCQESLNKLLGVVIKNSTKVFVP